MVVYCTARGRDVLYLARRRDVPYHAETKISGSISGRLYGTDGYIQTYGEFALFEWNGDFWKTLEEGLCRNRYGHTTFIYAGEIYHMGG